MSLDEVRDFFSMFRPCVVCEEECDKRLVSPYRFLCDNCYNAVMQYKYKTDFASIDDLAFSYQKSDTEKTKAKIKVKSLFRYEGEARTLLLQYKMEGSEKIKAFFIDSVNEYLDANFDKDSTLLIPLPCSSKGFRTRGFDQCSEILKGLHYKWCPGVELLKKHAKQQKLLSGKDREISASGKYGIDKEMIRGIANRFNSFILFDDVLTTGSSLKSVLSELYPFVKTINPKAKVSALTLFREESLL